MEKQGLLKTNRNLPTNINDLARFMLILPEKLKSVRAEISAINKLKLSKDVYNQKMEEARWLSGVSLDAFIKMGEFIKEIPKDNPNKERIAGRGHSLAKMGITQKMSNQCQLLAEHKDIVERVKSEAVENDDLPTRTEALRQIKELNRKDIIFKKSAELPKGKYQVIYADPPWLYNQEQHSKEKQDTVLATHYPSMPTEEICNLPINDLGLDNSVLFLWTTSPKLFEAKQVIDAWGYEYKASMIWDKVKHNVGYYVSVRHEILLICTKGSCLPDNPKLHDSVITEERTEHSKKPDKFYEIIEDIYKGSKIELFARKKRDGLDSWGNQL